MDGRNGSPRASRLRVLVIDDEPQFGPTLALALGDEMDIVVAPDGSEGLARLARDEAFDVILCDLMMPGTSGMDVYRVLSDRPSLRERVVFVTGGTFTERARVFLDSIPNARLEKPFGLSELRRVVYGVRGVA